MISDLSHLFHASLDLLGQRRAHNAHGNSMASNQEKSVVRADGRTPLHSAVIDGDLVAVKRLVTSYPEGIERRGFIDQLTADHATSLSLAIFHGYPEVVSFLVEEKADLGFLDHLVRLAACNEECGDKMIETLLSVIPVSARADYVNATECKGNTALHWACLKGSVKTVEKLLEAGGIAACVNKQGQTLLMAAICSGKNDILELLMKNIGREGTLAYVKRKDEELISEFDISYGIESMDDAAKYIKEDGNLAFLPKISGRLERAQRVGVVGNVPDAVSKFLWPRRPNDTPEVRIANCVHIVDLQGNTALHWAAWNGNVEAVDRIYKAGGKLYHRNKKGDTPLMIAASNGHTEVLKYLLTVIGTVGVKKLDYINMKRRNGDTALVLSVQEGHCDAVRCLLGVGKPDRLTLEELLRFAAENKNSDVTVVEAVLNEIPDADKANSVNAVNEDGNSALHLACMEGLVDAIGILVKAGGKIYQANGEGKTPLVLAAIEGHEHVVSFISDTYYELRRLYDYG